MRKREFDKASRESEAVRLYTVAHLSTREVADRLGVGKTVVWKFLSDIGIIRNKSESQHVKLVSRQRGRKQSIRMSGANHPNWKGGKRRVRHVRARRVWEKHWQEKAPAGYHVHHIDRDITNNDICNLALLTVGYHGSIHGKEGGRGNKKTWGVILEE